MSLACMTWVFKHSETTLGRRLVLLALADYAHDDGSHAWPSNTNLAGKARLDKRHVQKLLRELEQQGHIEKMGESKHGTNIWRVVMDLEEIARLAADSGGDEGEGGGEGGGNLPPRQDAIPPVANPTVSGAKMPPEPSELTVSERSTAPLNPPQSGGPDRMDYRREQGTNPRAQGTNPRARAGLVRPRQHAAVRLAAPHPEDEATVEALRAQLLIDLAKENPTEAEFVRGLRPLGRDLHAHLVLSTGEPERDRWVAARCATMIVLATPPQRTFRAYRLAQPTDLPPPAQTTPAAAAPQDAPPDPPSPTQGDPACPAP